MFGFGPSLHLDVQQTACWLGYFGENIKKQIEYKKGLIVHEESNYKIFTGKMTNKIF